ncbi:MAG: twin-arginine translocase subunit TatC [Candidatus Caenarcaniphilales bacterium]|nr:twin-arginine translocase subunit TatC [Candidatus Caenarcaniphilales bacterium]
MPARIPGMAVDWQDQDFWFEHLDELRSRFFWCIGGLLLALIVAYLLTPKILGWLEALAPKGTSFFQLKPGELIFVYFRLTFYQALLLISPLWLYHLGAFVLPGLLPHEKRIFYVVAIGGSLLFVAGITFAYLVLAKPVLNFLLTFGLDRSLITPQYGLDNYISLVTALLIVCGIAFQLPVVLFLLVLLDLVTSRQLLSQWRFACFGAMLLAAFLTPTPDPLNMLLLGGALIALYFLSLFLIFLSGK